MIRWFLLFLTIFSNASSLKAGVWDDVVNKFQGKTTPQPPSIRALIVHDKEKVKVEVAGKYSLYDPYTDSHITSRLVGKSRDIQAMHDGLKWGEAFPGLYQIKIQPDEPKKHERGNLWASNFQNALTRIDGNDYPGSIYVYDIGGTLSIVNQIPVEEYIRYIMADFPENSVHPEVLAALAIVVRTNAYYQSANPKSTYWAVDAAKVGYRGRYPVPKCIDSAVSATRYMIMSRTGVYERMATPFAAQFDSTSPNGNVKDVEISRISLTDANEMAKKGEHAAQILAKAFPGSTIMLMHYAN